MSLLAQSASLAFPSAGSERAAEQYFIILLYAIFALAERKNRTQTIVRCHAAASEAQQRCGRQRCACQ
jgi:hypothetical protein